MFYSCTVPTWDIGYGRNSRSERVKKAYSLAKMAVEMDPELEPLLRWKQFRVAQELYDH